jgi:hypothetical protein
MSHGRDPRRAVRGRLVLGAGVGAVAIAAAGLAIGPALVSSPAARTSVEYVQSASGSSSGESLSVGYREHVGTGDLLVGQFRTEGRTAVADTVNGPWSEAAQTVDGDVTHSLWYRQNAAAGRTTVTLTGSARGELRGVIAEYSGIVPEGALDRASCEQGDSPTPETGPTASSEAGELLFAGLGAFEHPISVRAGSSVGTSATLRAHLTAQHGTSVEEDVLSTARGAQEASFQLSAPAPGGWAACMATFRRQPAPQVSWLPTVEGAARVGGTLRTTNGSWSGGPIRFAYAWRRCNPRGLRCASIADARASSYEVSAADVEHTLRAAVTAVNAGGAAGPEVSGATAVVASP